MGSGMKGEEVKETTREGGGGEGRNQDWEEEERGRGRGGNGRRNEWVYRTV